MSPRTVHLGFEVGSAKPVEIPIFHMAVTGQTQKSGKTTALEGLISRAGLRAIAFITKRGEGSFQTASRIKPYFKERTDWQFVQSILETILRQGQQYKQPWIMRACEGARTLADVRNRAHQLEQAAKNALSQDMYMVLGAYLDSILPQLSSLPKAPVVELPAKGLAVMDLVQYPLELQMLVIASTLQWIFDYEQDVVAIIPEAWEFIPESKNTPVKFVAEKLMRKGAGIGIYLWIDSQDMASVAKMMLRACAVSLVGVQREANEVKRALANMQLKKPKAADVVALGLGQFFVCTETEIRKTYVQPAWMDEAAGSAIASGRLDVHEVTPPNTTKAKQPAQAGTRAGEVPLGSPATALDSPVLRTSAIEEEEMPINEQTLTALRLAIRDGARETALRLVDGIAGVTPAQTPAPSLPPPTAIAPPSNGEPSVLSDALYRQIFIRLLQDLPEHPTVLQLVASRPEIMVRVQKQTVELDGTTLRGRLAILISENFFVDVVNANIAHKELQKRGVGSASPNVYRELDKLAEMGFLFKLKEGYQSVPGMKVTKNRMETA
jgi:hypothetical protein